MAKQHRWKGDGKENKHYLMKSIHNVLLNQKPTIYKVVTRVVFRSPEGIVELTLLQVTPSQLHHKALG